MAITFSISANPHWVIIDNFDKLPVGAVIYTYSSLNKSQFKPAYQDAAGSIAYGAFIQGFDNGTFPPIFWQFDSTNPSDTYYIRVYDKENFPGNDANFLWDFDGISGGGSGGGGVITNNSELQNILINGQFYRNSGSNAGPLGTQITLAPSNHDGFVGLGTTPNFEPVGPDIIFAKSNSTENDSITFTDFTLGDDFFNDTPTPKQFVRYVSDAAGTANYKFIQFPLVKGVQNLSGQNISVQMWNLLNGSSTNIKLSLRQFFGNGAGASADVVTDIASLNLAVGTWTKTLLNSFTVPNVSGKVIGNCGNDAVYLQLVFPASEAIDLSFILPAVYPGDVTSDIDFHTLDYVDSIVNTPRTGDIRTSLNAFSPFGWLQMNDGTIGDLASNATARKNIDTFPLFDLIWNTFQGSPTLQALAPMLTSAGASIAYGATSWQDFGADRQLTLTRNLGRVMSGTLPAQTTVAFTSPVANTLTVASTAAFITGAGMTISSSSAPSILANGVTYYVNISSSTTMFIYHTANDAINDTNRITFGIGAVTGNAIFPAHALGSFIGDETHTQTIAEMPNHDHTIVGVIANTAAAGGVSTYNTTGGVLTSPTSFVGGGNPMTIMQPTTYLNVMIKL